MCKLICVLIAPDDADVWCGSSDAAVLICTGVWGLLSFIALILYLRWHGDHSSAHDKPITKPPDLPRTPDFY
jgi:hypothetical protein